MSNKMYDILKFMAQVIIPAVATFYLAISQIWGLPYGNEISATLMAVDTFMGAVLHISSINYNNKEE